MLSEMGMLTLRFGAREHGTLFYLLAIICVYLRSSAVNKIGCIASGVKRVGIGSTGKIVIADRDERTQCCPIIRKGGNGP